MCINAGRIYIVAQLVYLPCLWLLPHRRQLATARQQLAKAKSEETSANPQLANARLPPLVKPELSPTTAG